MKSSKTYSAKPTDVVRRWILIDASETTLGRTATVIATYLTGKNKPSYTPHIDCGDHVVVINADKIAVSGNKMEDKTYYRHSGYPSGMKTASLKEKMEKNSANVIEAAVKGMLPKNKLSPARMARLRVFADENHGHNAQQPQKVEVKRG